MSTKNLSWENHLLSKLGVTELCNSIVAHKNLIVFSMLVALLCYGYDVFNFSLRIDSEFHASEFGAKAAWAAQGRWGMYFLNQWLLPDSVMPVVPVVLAVLGLCFGGLLLLASMAGGKGSHNYLAIALLITCPIFYFVNYFTTLGYGIGIGYLLVGLGTYLLIRKSAWWLPGVIVCYTGAIGIYQAFLPVIAVAFGVAVIDHYIERNSEFSFLWKRSLYFLTSLLLSYLCYELIKNGVLAALELTFDDAYLSNFNRFQMTSEFMAQSAQNSWDAIRKYYTGAPEFYLYPLNILSWLFWTSVGLFLLRVICCQQGLLGKILTLIIFSLVLAAPAAMLFMNNGLMPPRTQLAVPLVLAGTVYLAARLPSFTARALLTVLVLACTYKFIVAVNRYSFSNLMQWESDKAYSLQLLTDINKVWSELPTKTIHGKYAVELVGVRYDPETPILINREVIGTSFYQWSAGDIHRVVGLLRTMGVTDYRGANLNERLKVVAAAKQMPKWPLPGSVQVIENVIVIKIDEYNPNQLMLICRGKSHLPQCQ